MSDERRVRELLGELTGFSHAVFVQHGTAATELVLRTLGETTVAVPAFGCWTLPYAVTRAQRRCVFRDVDAYWGALPGGGLAIAIEPWGAPAVRPRGGVSDLTLAPGARLDGELAGVRAAAGVLSLGRGKPVDLGGGGVALFNDERAAYEAHRRFRFGFEDGQWRERGERYSFPPALFAPLRARLEGLPSLLERHERAEADRAVLAAADLGSNALRPGGAWGVSSTLPVVVPESFPLSTRDIEGVAITVGLPLARHPVGPAYLEPAWRHAARGACPNAEALATRTMFFHADDAYDVSALPAFFERLAEDPEPLRSPYALPAPRGVLSAPLTDLARHARLVRGLDGAFGLFDEAHNALWPIDDHEAAHVQLRKSPPARCAS